MESLQGIEAGKVQEFKYLRESGQSDGECQRDSRARAKCRAVCFRDGSNDRKTGDVLLCVTILMDTLKKKSKCSSFIFCILEKWLFPFSSWRIDVSLLGYYFIRAGKENLAEMLVFDVL